MTEPFYETEIIEIGNGADPPKPTRRHFYFKELSGQSGTGSVICQVYYGNSNNKNALISNGAHHVDSENGFLMPESETASYAFMKFTLRNFNKEIDDLVFVAEPV